MKEQQAKTEEKHGKLTNEILLFYEYSNIVLTNVLYAIILCL